MAVQLVAAAAGVQMGVQAAVAHLLPAVLLLLPVAVAAGKEIQLLLVLGGLDQ